MLKNLNIIAFMIFRVMNFNHTFDTKNVLENEKKKSDRSKLPH